MTEAEADVEELLNEAISGAREQLGQLLEMYRNYLTMLASTQINERLRCRVSPSDVVQETMLAAHCDYGLGMSADLQGAAQSIGHLIRAAS